jgi:hypothetical protein
MPPLDLPKGPVDNRVGLMPARLGSSHVMRGPDGRSQSVLVGSRAHHDPDTPFAFRCLLCGVNFRSREALEEEHAAQLTEAHVWVLWSESTGPLAFE